VTQTPANRFFNIKLHDTTLLKGWAILLIVLHNFFHLLYKVTKENEMSFDPQRFIALTTETLSNPAEWAHGFFTYFGHFGVQVFIFLSAYGMVMSHANASSHKIDFFWSRLKKIYPTFFIVVLIWLGMKFAWDIGLDGVSLADELAYTQSRLLDVLKVALGIHNMLPGHHYPMVGPWWFIPFIMQFYLLWALFGTRIVSLSKNAMIGLGIAGVLFNYIAPLLIESTLRINMLFSPLGHVPELMLGVYWAKYGLNIRPAAAAVAALLFIASSLSIFAWPLHHITALVVLLWLTFHLIRHCPGPYSRALTILGVYSLPLFLVNGFLRPPFLKIARHFEVWYVDFLAAGVLLVFALGVAIAVGKTAQFLTQRGR